MIQRKQTLFLILSVFASLALLIIPCNYITKGGTIGVSVIYLYTNEVTPSIWHYLGTGIDFAAILLALITIFLFRKRSLQVKFSYVLMLLQLAMTLIVSFCSVVVKTEELTITNSGLASIIGIIGMMAAYFAAYYIKKDIELLKSADRIR